MWPLLLPLLAFLAGVFYYYGDTLAGYAQQLSDYYLFYLAGFGALLLMLSFRDLY